MSAECFYYSKQISMNFSHFKNSTNYPKEIVFSQLVLVIFFHLNCPRLIFQACHSLKIQSTVSVFCLFQGHQFKLSAKCVAQFKFFTKLFTQFEFFDHFKLVVRLKSFALIEFCTQFKIFAIILLNLKILLSENSPLSTRFLLF